MSFFAIRKGERRDAWAAFLTLFALIASHSLLETARDALFLAKIPATHLPWVFLAIAGSSLGILKLNALAARRLNLNQSSRWALSRVTLGASLITGTFFAFHRQFGKAGLYALYVWSGLLASFVLVRFWQLVGERFTITQAKRLYGFIGAGSVLGAILGSGAASLLARVMPAPQLVLVAAVGLAIAGLMPLLFRERELLTPRAEQTLRLGETFSYVAREPYARRLAFALFMATVCLTLSDFVFKSTLARWVPKAELGAFLGTVYFGVNVLSLLCQVGLVAWILKRFSLGAALGVLPLLLAVGGFGVLATAGLGAVVLLKSADGALRYSLHRTTAELLVLPFFDEGRRRVKAFLDMIGQRAGQVLASLALLGLSALNASPRLVAALLVLASCVWLVSALSLREPYVALFRARLKAGRTSQLDEFPALDLSSLETLLEAFESPNDREVLAALTVLERENKHHLVPALLLHHPAELVVIQVLDILTRSGRVSAVPTIDRIADHTSAKVRAAVVAARSILAPDPERLRQALVREPAEEVRTAITINLFVSGDFAGSERESELERLLAKGLVSSNVALAEAVGRRAAQGFDHVLVRLLGGASLEVRCAALRAMGNVGSTGLLPHVIGALSDEATRRAAEAALNSYGGVAFDALRETFEDRRTDVKLRWRIPAAMASCNPELALGALVRWLPEELDGGVRFGILLVLERLTRRHPQLPVDHAALERSVAATLTRAYRYLDARMVLQRGPVPAVPHPTPGHALLCDLLQDKERNARGRLFRMLALLYPAEDFAQIHRGLLVGREQRATSLELIESILSEPLRSAILGLVDDAPDEVRLRRAGVYYRPLPLEYSALLFRLSRGESDAVRQVARYHADELRLADAWPTSEETAA